MVRLQLIYLGGKGSAVLQHEDYTRVSRELIRTTKITEMYLILYLLIEIASNRAYILLYRNSGYDCLFQSVTLTFPYHPF